MPCLTHPCRGERRVVSDPAPPRPPRSTARIQLATAGGPDGLIHVIDHLHRLGVSHLYTSPATAAVPGSTHGYDQTDPRVVGDWTDAAGLERVSTALRERGMGWVVDVVPNHLAAHHTNAAWWDLLRRGTGSPYARWFDVLWEHGDELVPDRLLLAVLGDHYGAELDRGAIRVERPEGASSWVVTYGDLRFPLADGTEDDARQIAAAGGPDGRQDPDRLHELLRRQHYRLAWWRIADSELDHRRFFDVDDLVGVRVEDPEVFDATHALHLAWVDQGRVDGLRIDHPDGLADPTGYVRRLRDRAPGAWIVVEKILVGDEPLRDWPVDGTTGYEAGALIDRVLVDPTGVEALDAVVERVAGVAAPAWDDVRRQAKVDVLDRAFAAELRRLIDDLVAYAPDAPQRLDLSRASADVAIRAVLVEMPVYRTYAIDGAEADETDAAVIDRVAAALEAHPHDADPAVVALVLDTLRGPVTSEAGVSFRRRFQQASGPVMAKGVEDTACYRFPRLVSANEVGADPGRPAATLDEFHAAMADASRRWPRRMVTTSTHDSKRSEDVRARIAVLSELPDEWELAVKALDDRLAACMSDAGASGVDAPDRDPLFELLVHQSWFGAHPISAERAVEYARKAAREAKRLASWDDADSPYERALLAAVEACASDPEYQHTLAALVDRTEAAARCNTLALKLLALTIPGVPDLYQGSEIVVRSLVDPDNRRPVDIGRVVAVREEATSASGPLLDGDVDVAKMRVVLAALAARTANPAAFLEADSYVPLRAEGDAADHLIAFVRGGEVATLATRWCVRLERAGGWRDTTVELPPGDWEDALTGERHTGRVVVGSVLRTNPVALLVRS